MANWEIFDGKDVHGPFTEEALVSSIRAGLPSTVMVRREGEGDWASMRSHAPFAYALGQSTVAQAPPPVPAPPPVVQVVTAPTSWGGCGNSCGLLIILALIIFVGIPCVGGMIR
jgi:hypothetical protein